MWKGLLNQIQDKIDDAVDMLQNDDGVDDEEYEEDSEEGEKVQAAEKLKQFFSHGAPTARPPLAAVEPAQAPAPVAAQATSQIHSTSTGVEKPAVSSSDPPNNWGWSSDSDLDLGDGKEPLEVLTGPAPSVSVQPELTTTKPETEVTPAQQPPSPGVSPATVVEGVSPEAAPAPLQAADGGNATEPMVLGENTAVSAAVLKPPQETELTTESTNEPSGESERQEAEALPDSTTPPPPVLGAASTAAAEADKGTPDNQSTPSEAAPGELGLAESVEEPTSTPLRIPSPPLPSEGNQLTAVPDLAPCASAAARPAEGHAQLLRFQQQLADEMANSAALTEENAGLKSRLADVEAALATAQKTIAASADSSEALSTLIEKLGREKERNKHVVEERNNLREQVAELEGVMEDYRAKEATWLSNESAQAQSQTSAQQHIAQLETDLRKRTARVEELEGHLAEAERARTLLSSQLQEARKKHETAVEQIKTVNSESLEQAEREVERLRGALRRGSADYDERILSLEQELREANARAHQAEERLSDLERGSVGSLRGLRNELEDMHARVSSLTTELGAVRSENAELLERYSSIKKARASEEAVHRERQAAQSATLSALAEEKAALSKSLAAAKAQIQAADSELTELRRRCMILETANGQVKASSSPFATSHAAAATPLVTLKEGGAAGDDNNGSSAFQGGSPFQSASAQEKGEHRGSNPATPTSSSTYPRGSAQRPAARPMPLFTPAPPFSFGGAVGEDVLSSGGNGGDSTALTIGDGGASNRTRLEREMVRQAVEIERLKKIEAEAVTLRTKLRDMEAQYDLMLQLYGQMEEDLKAAKLGAARGAPAS